MAKIRFGIVGSGWRSLFYVRLFKRYPEIFDLVGVLCRSEEKALSFKALGVRAFLEEKEFLSLCPDFVVVAVNKASIATVSLSFVEKGLPVVCETPAAMTEEDLDRIWASHLSGGRILVAEQYPYLPEIRVLIENLDSGLIGERSSLYLSRAHEYHAFALMRAILAVPSSEAFSVRAVTSTFNVVRTQDRYKSYEDGVLKESQRTAAYIVFESGKTCLYDFEGEEYHSKIRGYSLRVSGVRGEFKDGTYTYLDEKNQVLEKTVNIKASEVRDDEEAIKTVLEKASSLFSETRASEEETTLLSSALQDSYSAILLREASESGEIVNSGTKGWNAVCRNTYQ